MEFNDGIFDISISQQPFIYTGTWLIQNPRHVRPCHRREGRWRDEQLLSRKHDEGNLWRCL